jgi:hypothetical protein
MGSARPTYRRRTKMISLLHPKSKSGRVRPDALIGCGWSSVTLADPDNAHSLGCHGGNWRCLRSGKIGHRKFNTSPPITFPSDMGLHPPFSLDTCRSDTDDKKRCSIGRLNVRQRKDDTPSVAALIPTAHGCKNIGELNDTSTPAFLFYAS